jgi:hypothetical protein
MAWCYSLYHSQCLIEQHINCIKGAQKPKECEERLKELSESERRKEYESK